MCVCVCVFVFENVMKVYAYFGEKFYKHSSHLNAYLIEWVTAHQLSLTFDHVHIEMRRGFKELLAKVRSHS